MSGAGDPSTHGPFRGLGGVGQDLRLAARTLRRRPLLAVVTAATLGLGIGVNAIMFSIVNGVLLRPLPYPDSDRLVFITRSDLIAFTYPECEAWREQSRSVFDEFGTFSRDRLRVVGGDHPELVQGAFVNSGLFSSLAVAPALGRLFTPADDQPGAPGVAVLSHGIWQRSFGADPGALGQAIHTHEGTYTVVGVMPPGFAFPIDCEIWTSYPDELKENPIGRRMYAIARLRTGISLDLAHTGLDVIADRIAARFPASRPDESDPRLRLVHLQEAMTGNSRLPLLILLGIVGVVLLIACANIANILLIRATEQYRELVVRLALGTGRGRLLTHLVSEGLVLSLTGGVVGFGLALISLKPFVTLLPANIPRIAEIAVDFRVLAFGVILSVITGVCVGLLSAVGIGRLSLPVVLHGSGRGLTHTHRWNRLLSALVVSEIALTFVLFIAAGLLIRSFTRLTAVDPGSDLEHRLTLWVAPPEELTDSEDLLRRFYLDLTARLEAVPGVEAVGGSSQMPFADRASTYPIVFEGREEEGAEQVECSMVTASYFPVMGIPIIEGRAFTPEEDLRCSPPAVVVSRAMAHRYWPDGEAVGRRVRFPWYENTWFTIVGVAGDVHHQGLSIQSRPKYYLPLGFAVDDDLRRYAVDDDLTYVVKTRGDPASIAPAARDAIWSLDDNILITNISTFEDLISQSVASPRFQTILLSLFAALAAAIAVLGIFGVLVYSVVQRTHEIGIRMALGAGVREVMRGILKRGLRLVGTGLAIGLVVCLFATRALESLLFEISPTDPLTLVAGALLFTAIAMVASYVPARRATRVDPMVALKHE
jgi:putative ABC transport system permease protein